jgi:hypothetical protein
LRERGVGGRGGFAAGERAGRFADESRGVGHDADDASVRAESGFEFGEGDASGDGDEEVLVGERVANLRECSGDLVGLGGED